MLYNECPILKTFTGYELIPVILQSKNSPDETKGGALGCILGFPCDVYKTSGTNDVWNFLCWVSKKSEMEPVMVSMVMSEWMTLLIVLIDESAAEFVITLHIGRRMKSIMVYSCYTFQHYGSLETSHSLMNSHVFKKETNLWLCSDSRISSICNLLSFIVYCHVSSYSPLCFASYQVFPSNLTSTYCV